MNILGVKITLKNDKYQTQDLIKKKLAEKAEKYYNEILDLKKKIRVESIILLTQIIL